MGLLNKSRAECRRVLAQLEDVSGGTTVREVLEAMPAGVRQHAQGCPHCQEAAGNLLASRALLSGVRSSADLGGPWFASRVMAAIAARKAELSLAADTWTFLPKLASRLTWASSIALLLASAWLYQKPATLSSPATSAKSVATDITGDPVVEPSAQSNTDDEFLLSLAEKQK